MSLRHPFAVLLAVFGWGAMAVLYLPVVLHFLPVRVVIGAPSAADCAWRISTAGIIHGPDSPYRAMTPPTRCYATEAAARAALQEGSP